jgi:hypothetical protein
MTMQESVSTSRPADPPPVDETGRDAPRRATRAGGTSPLLAVCGLCGGAGTSTLSYLVARFAVAKAPGHVLVCDTGGPADDLAACARVQSPRSLLEAAARVARGLPLHGGLYAVDEPAGSSEHELRVIATGPRLADADGTDGLELLLAMARNGGAHALTVVDCGTLTRAAEQIALAKASHIAWVLPATPSGVRRGARVLGAVNPYLLGRELVVARRDEREPKAALDDLKRLAEQRDAPLILVPHLPDLDTGKTDAALAAAQVSLQAIDGVLER